MFDWFKFKNKIRYNLESISSHRHSGTYINISIRL